MEENGDMDNTKKKPKTGLSRLLEFAAMRLPLVICSLVLSVLAALASFLPYLAIFMIVREVLGSLPDVTTADGGLLIRYGWLAFAGAAGNVILYFGALVFSHLAAFGTLYQLKVSFASHLSRLPLGFVALTGSGRLRKIMDENIEKIEGFIAHQLPDLVAAVTAPVAMIIILLVVDWRFGLAVLVGIVVALWVQFRVYGDKSAKSIMSEYQHSLEDMNNASVEYVRGIGVVKAFRQTAYSFTRLRETFSRYTKSIIPYTLRSRDYYSVAMTIVNNVSLFLLPVAMVVGMTTTDYIGFVTTVFFYLVFSQAVGGIVVKAVYVSGAMMQVNANVETMDAVLSAPELPASAKPQAPESYDLAFDAVSFAYGSVDLTALVNVEKTVLHPGLEASQDAAPQPSAVGTEAATGNPSLSTSSALASGSQDTALQPSAAEAPQPQPLALDAVTFTAEQGKSTAIVGPSGGGKTTIAHLVPRFFDVTSGSVRIGGIDVREIDQHRLMDLVSFVFQDVYLFRLSVAENIRMGRLDASDEQVIAAARAAQCHSFIERLPQGYDTVINTRGVHLSGGERQRIAIARAIIKDAPIVVLDEATAFSDPENEHLIQQAFEQLLKGKTVLMIAHRLSTVCGADKIVVIDGGRVVQQGSHDELLASEGRYRDMWQVYQQTVNWRMGRRLQSQLQAQLQAQSQPQAQAQPQPQPQPQDKTQEQKEAANV
jgi:ATP-binding cassette subfamily B protein